jgi:hypothetical protein
MVFLNRRYDEEENDASISAERVRYIGTKFDVYYCGIYNHEFWG